MFTVTVHVITADVTSGTDSTVRWAKGESNTSSVGTIIPILS